MSRIFGGSENLTSNLYLPLTSCEWTVEGVASKNEYKNIALFGLALDDNEAVDIRRCFNDITHIFAFGRNFKASTISVSFMCFLGEECQSKNTGFADAQAIRKKYEQARIYKKLASLKIEIDKLQTKGFLVGLSIHSMDALHETCIITCTFIPDEEV